MYTIEAFTTMLSEFMTNLTVLFPEDMKLLNAKRVIATSIKVDPKSVVNMFMEEVGPYVERIRAKDPTVFAEASKGELFQHLPLEELWNRDLSDKTRESIWSYLNTLTVIGTMISSISDDMLQNIESIAARIAENPDQMDLQGLMKNLGPMFQ